MAFTLLDQFKGLFERKAYLHRNSTQGDFVAQFLFEDLYALGRSSRFKSGVDGKELVLNTKNRTRGVKHRRGDGSLGVLIPGEEYAVDPGFVVARGPIAKLHIGVEVKILAKAMIKQIDRVTGDLRKQVTHFRRSGPETLAIGIVGINHAEICRGFEGEREHVTDGRKHKHPVQEALDATARIEEVRADFDELLVLPFRATNLDPFKFEWVDQKGTRQDYASALVRLAAQYEQKFRQG